MIMKSWNVGILLFDHVDILDYSGPYEVFALTVRENHQVQSLLMSKLPIEEKPFRVKTISQNGELITAHNGLKIQPDCSFTSLDQPLDLLIVPGGPMMAIKNGLRNTDMLRWIKTQKAGSIVASVCTGALLLAEAGLLSGRQATTNSFALDFLERSYPEVEVVRNVRFVDNGEVLTSAGVSAGIDMSLYIAGKLLGEEAAVRTAATIEYPYYTHTK